MQSPQISTGASQPGAAEQFSSSQSVAPSQSLSVPSPQTSGWLVQSFGHCSAWVYSQRPAEQASMVHSSASTQSLTCSQVLQPGIATWPQLLSAWQTSAVQALWSSQSVAVVHGTQPGRSVWPQTPSALQVSSVQVLLSVQSLIVAQETHPGMLWCAQAPASQESVVQPLPSPHSAAVVQGTQPGIVVP